MAGSSLFLLIDDIATILDDVATMTKIATKKTAGVLADDLALNAHQVSGVKPNRELPVVWAVARGSAINKLILVPAALVISVYAPWAITPLLMTGGAYLCYEGVEKFFHGWSTPRETKVARHNELLATIKNNNVNIVAVEKEKIKGAIRTDFILSAEIIIIALGTVAAAAFGKQLLVLSIVAIGMTIGVYGLVAGIVKLDDAGLYLTQKSGADWWTTIQHRSGAFLLHAAPLLMRFLSVAGSIAMFLVGGGILVHGIPAVQLAIGGVALLSGGVPYIGMMLDVALPVIFEGLFGVLAGVICLLAVVTIQAAIKKFSAAKAP